MGITKMATKDISPHIGGGSSNIGAGSGDIDQPWIPDGDGISGGSQDWVSNGGSQDGITQGTSRPGI